ncbi:MAG: peptidoglycan editing factor PgeF [Rhodospirillales bacterium]|nr:peptidoglycan editing factor PgeF [Rhodospirillales bacterium]
MLQPVEHDNGVVTFESPTLRDVGVAHGFATRVGGVSGGAYASLNLAALAKGEGDANTNVAENLRRLRMALGLKQHMRVEVRQVHGGEVWRPPVGAVHPRDCPEADALVTADARQLLLIRVADCVAVLLASEDGRVVAAAHAGWRGVVAGVVTNTVEQMRATHGVEPARLRAAIGPAIGVDHFEVGEEVATAFVEADLAECVRRGYPKRPHVDLQAAVRAQLCRAGLREEHIDGNACCTFRDAALFFSHRRDKGVTGRMGAVIAPKK